MSRMTFLSSPQRLRLARALFWAAIVTTLVFAWTPHPPTLLSDDKSQHMLAFGVLSVLAALAYPRLAPWKTAVLLLVLGGVIELVQGIPFVHRDCDIFDWLADAIAIGIAALFLTGIRALA